MNAYRMTLLVIDHEETGADGAAYALEAVRYINASVLTVEAADIGEWEDDHPLNSMLTQAAEIARLDWLPVKLTK